MKNKLLSLSLIAATVPFAVSCSKKDTSCSTIKDNYRQYVYFNTNIDDYIATPVDIIKSELKSKEIAGVETYYFKDIDYNEDKTRSSWAAAGHLSRTLKLAIVAEERNSNEIRDIVKKLTYHWVFSNYHNINWWQNELGANSTLANLGLFAFDYLSKKGQDAFNGKIRESSLKYRPSVGTHTGANVIDYIDITCRNAAINNDKEEMNIAFDRLVKEIRNDGIEGFQKDGSFFQHGRQVQNVSYGKSVIRAGKTLYNLRNTNYKMPEDKMKIISDYILKGLRDSTFKGYTNYTTVSREYSRVNNLDTQSSGLNELVYYLGVDSFTDKKVKEDIYNFITSLRKRKNALSEDTITYFPIAKMIVANIGHGENKDGIYISYKATEPNLTNTECVNGENQLGLNLSYGTNTCVMDKGTEYFNIAPVMDYNYMPGTTSVKYGTSSSYKENDDQIKYYAQTVYSDTLYEKKVPAYKEGENNYVYNDGQDNDVAFSMTRTKHHDRASYTVTCFTTKDGMVLVGSDFGYDKQTSDPGELSTNKHTTLDQYVTSDKIEKAESKKETIRNHSDGNVKYTSLVSTQTISKKIESRSYSGADWKRNNRDLSTTDSGSKNVATITLDGDNVSSYAYAIEPYSETASKFKLACNSNDIHAIELPNNKIVAAFYSDGHKTFNYGGKDYTFTETVVGGKGAFKVFDK